MKQNTIMESGYPDGSALIETILAMSVWDDIDGVRL